MGRRLAYHHTDEPVFQQLLPETSRASLVVAVSVRFLVASSRSPFYLLRPSQVGNRCTTRPHYKHTRFLLRGKPHQDPTHTSQTRSLREINAHTSQIIGSLQLSAHYSDDRRHFRWQTMFAVVLSDGLVRE